MQRHGIHGSPSLERAKYSACFSKRASSPALLPLAPAVCVSTRPSSPPISAPAGMWSGPRCRTLQWPPLSPCWASQGPRGRLDEDAGSWLLPCSQSGTGRSRPEGLKRSTTGKGSGTQNWEEKEHVQERGRRKRHGPSVAEGTCWQHRSCRLSCQLLVQLASRLASDLTGPCFSNALLQSSCHEQNLYRTRRPTLGTCAEIES